MSEIETFWNGEPCEARRVLVYVGLSPLASWWCAPLAHTVRQAVEVRYGEQHFFLDNEEGHEGWWAVTEGMGSPNHKTWSLPNESVVIEPSTKFVARMAESLAEEFAFIGGGRIEAAPEAWEKAARGVIYKLKATEFTLDEDPLAMTINIRRKETF